MTFLKTLKEFITERHIPVLGTVKFKDKFLTSTNLDLSIHVYAPKLAASLRDDTLYHPLSIENGLYDIESPVPAADFPELKLKGAAIAWATFDQRSIDSLEWADIAASDCETRKYLNGLYFDPKGDIVGTDGHRLHTFAHKIEYAECVGKDDRRGFMVHRETIRAILLLLKETNLNSFKIEFFQNEKARIQIGEHYIISKLLDGTFPNWRKVIPEHKKKTIFDVAQWRVIYKEASILREISGHPAELSLGVNNQNFLASFETLIDSVGLKTWVTESDFNVNIVLDAKYAKDLISGDCLYGGSNDPVVIKSGRNEFKKTAVIMPLRT